MEQMGRSRARCWKQSWRMNHGAPKRWRRGWDKPQSGAGRCMERDLPCQDWQQAVRTQWPEPRAKLTGVGGAQDDVWFPQQPGGQATLEKHPQVRRRHRNLSAARASTHPNPGQGNANVGHWNGMCPTEQQSGHGWHGTGVIVPPRKVNPAVPFPGHP